MSQALLYQLVVFAPGAFAAYQRPHPLSDLASSTHGFPSVLVLQAPTADPAPEPITDFCSPSTVKVLLWGQTRDDPCTGTSCYTANDVCINGEFGGQQCPLVDPPVGTCGTPSGARRKLCPLCEPLGRGHALLQRLPAEPPRRRWGRHREPAGHGARSPSTCENPRSSTGPDLVTCWTAPATPGPSTTNHNQDTDNHASGAQWENAADNCPAVVEPRQQGRQAGPAAQHRGAAGRVAGWTRWGTRARRRRRRAGRRWTTTADTLVNDGCATVGGAYAEVVCTYSTSSEVDEDHDGLSRTTAALLSGRPEAGGGLHRTSSARTTTTATQ